MISYINTIAGEKAAMSGSKRQSCPVYSGTEPYGFISYAHADAERVLPVIEELFQDKFRLWYDAGIEAGTNWPEVVASHLMYAGAVVFFISARFLRSQNCIREVHYAVAQSKPMICVYLEPLELPGDLAMQFSTASVIRSESGEAVPVAQRIEALLGESFLGDGAAGYEALPNRKPRKNGWRILSLVFATLFLVSVLLTAGYVLHWFPSLGARTVTVPASVSADTAEAQPVEITVFQDSFTRDILLRAYSGASLYLCGNALISDPAAIRYADGAWSVGGTPVRSGDPDVLKVVVKKKGVTHLALVDQGIESFGALSTMEQLVYLDISGNPVVDLSFLRSLPALRTVKLMGIEAADFSALRELPALTTVYVDEASLGAVLDVLGDTAVDVVVKR